MRLLLILSAVLLAAIARAQNVGIGKSNPTEKLDVSGNVNIDGRLKLNGSAGQPGQTLMVQPDGSQQWISALGYKKRVAISPGLPFIVPAGVTELLIEVVGGGGGGAKGGGGGGGGYYIARVKVAPGATVSTSSSSYPFAGEPSSTEGGNGVLGNEISVGGVGFTILVSGGEGASNTTMGKGGNGGAAGDSLLYHTLIPGSSGLPMVESYSQRSATEFITIRKQGDGGACAYNPSSIARGGFFSFNSQTLFNVSLVYSQFSIYGFGYGGAGGNTFNGTAYWGGAGGSGVVFISY